ncbi:MAG: hypothetical protein GSR85_00605 [Desulfurococcales archaeon]|nr:hypothetical protein [Desulfurococcales archaeon]
MVDCPSRGDRILAVIINTSYWTFLGVISILLAIMFIEAYLGHDIFPSTRYYYILSGLIGFFIFIFWAWDAYQDHRDCIRAELFENVLYYTGTVTMLRQIASDINEVKNLLKAASTSATSAEEDQQEEGQPN